MGDRHTAGIGRRQLLRAGMIGLIAATTSGLESDAVADTETKTDKLKARYQANSAEIQNFYRVNRYPKR
jgi:hypothetical protein